MAVGGSEGEFGRAGIAEVWDGTNWTSVPLPKPMRGVSCPAADSCVAVGGENSLEGLPEAFAARWNGSSWAAEDPVLPADASDNAMELYDVDCAAGGCTAVGWYWSWGYTPLAERLPLVSGPVPPGTFTKPAVVTAHGAQLRATVYPKGLATTYQFEYGSSTDYGASVPVSAAGIGSGSDGVNVDETIGGLEPATVYHFRIVAVSSAGTTRSADRILVTPAEAPAVFTGPGASDITAGSATVSGSVNPNSAKVTNCHIDYGPSSSYGKSAPCSPASPGAGSEPVDVSASLTGLSPGTAYHFRVVATNGGGTTYGGGQVFATIPGPQGLDPGPRVPDPGPSRAHESGNDVGQVYRDCVARARGDYRRARKAAMRKRGSARRAALRHSARHKQQALGQCITRVDALL